MDLFKNIKSESMGTHQELLTIKIEKDLFIKQEPGCIVKQEKNIKMEVPFVVKADSLYG